jgi:hypothetical protein
MAYFLVRASLMLTTPVRDDQGQVVPGAYQVFGVRAADEAEAKAIVAAAVSDGSVDWDDSEIEVMSKERLADPTFASAAKAAPPGAIWWQTGRACYLAD